MNYGVLTEAAHVDPRNRPTANRVASGSIVSVQMKLVRERLQSPCVLLILIGPVLLPPQHICDLGVPMACVHFFALVCIGTAS